MKLRQAIIFGLILLCQASFGNSVDYKDDVFGDEDEDIFSTSTTRKPRTTTTRPVPTTTVDKEDSDEDVNVVNFMQFSKRTFPF